jgi:arylsulfatase A-like enzyme
MTAPSRLSTDASEVSGGAPVWWTAAAALLVGTIELVIRIWPRLAGGRLALTDAPELWLIPASYLALLIPGGVLLALARRAAPRLFGPALILGLSVFPAWGGLLWNYHPRLHRLSILILAVGLSVQTARVLARRLTRTIHAARWTVAILGVVLVLLATVPQAWTVVRERHRAARLAPAASGAPSVLLLILDTVRARSLSLYGYHRPTTPFLEQFVHEGTVFREAFATAPWTLPSHATMFTGRYPPELSAGWSTPLDARDPVLAEILAAHGYLTAGFVANQEYAGRRTGLGRGFLHYADTRLTPGSLLQGGALGRFLVEHPRVRRLLGWYDIPGRQSAEAINGRFLSWLDDQPERPFFAFLNYYDAHDPYLPPSPEDRAFTGPGDDRQLRARVRAEMAARGFRNILPAAERDFEQAEYDGALLYLDRQIARLIESLRRRGRLQNTVVIVAADHGELFGEHELYTHGNSLYVPLLHVPLLMAGKGRIPADTSITEPVTLRDLPATILDLVGLAGQGGIPGTSLAGLWRHGPGSQSPILAWVEAVAHQPARYPVVHGTMQSLVEGRYHAIRRGDGQVSLYDYLADPDETNDLAGDPGQAPLRRRLEAAADSFAGLGRAQSSPTRASSSQ